MSTLLSSPGVRDPQPDPAAENLHAREDTNPNCDLPPEDTPLKVPADTGGMSMLQRLAVYTIAGAAAVALLYTGRVFFITVLIAVIIAFLLDPLVSLVMRIRLSRGAASFVVCSMAVIVLYLGGVGLYSQVLNLTDEIPTYSERISQVLDSAAKQAEEFEKSVSMSLMPKRLQTPPPPQPQPRTARRRPTDPPPQTQPAVQEVRIKTEPTPFYRIIYDYVSSIYEVLLMASFVPFLVYFMLAWRDHLRVRFLSLFQEENREAARCGWHRMADVARAYVLGNFFLGLIVGVASAIFFAAVRVPYWPLVGPLSGFLSLVPYLGLPLAILPPLVAIIPVHADPAMYVFIASIVAILHLLALNLIYPKIVGSRVHLNPLVVTIALMFWGTMWGGIGLLLAVPITAGVKAVFDSVDTLRPYGKLLGD
jgi:predicted PurR-regulated permease PerM